MILTYCKDCYDTIEINISNVDEDNRHPDGSFVCKSCFYQKHDPNIKIVESRDGKLNQLLGNKPWWKIF